MSSRKVRSDVRQPRSNARDGGKEVIIVFLDNSNSMERERLAKGKNMLRRLFPSFQKAPTSIHLLSGSTVSVHANAFKERVEGNGGRYEEVAIRATLIWDDCNDLDLRVTEPNGNVVYYGAKRSSSGGELDIDRNAGGCRDHHPVENIRWSLGSSQPAFGSYKVEVNHFAKHADSVTSPFRVEVAVGSHSQEFMGTLSHVEQKEKVHAFDFQGAFPNRSAGDYESREAFPSTIDFTLDDVDQVWQAKAWTTYAWEYAYKVLGERGRMHSMTKIRAFFLLDGYDNDSPGQFNGPAGGIEMMNRLHREGIHPEINVFCIGNDAFMGDGGGVNYFRDLVQHSGGTYLALPDGATRDDELKALEAFSDNFTAPFAHRSRLAREVQGDWLRRVEAGEPVSNRDAEYTQELIAVGIPNTPLTNSPPAQCSKQGGIRKCVVH
mmetsp:Transcript_53356/g.120300  ORF Transcript_53356/g.120300 Transcript_53356/m.120300 type:complete len:435 (+) Transcript_53356:705-2009(+)